MREVPLTRGQVALVDDGDYDLVCQFKWWAKRGRDGRWYASGRVKRRQDSSPTTLHRFILNAPKGIIVDHIDGNGLNNQRHNLRFASYSGNVRNSKKPRTNTSGYKGARKLGRYYYAYITLDGKPKHFGGFASLEDAARGYDALARRHFGEFANLNFPDESANELCKP